jgi:hypothetical protein
MNELSEMHPSGFIKYTRMDMTKFRELVEMVRSAVQKKDTNMRLLVSVEKRKAVTIGLRYLATKKCLIELQQFKPFTCRRTELSCTASSVQYVDMYSASVQQVDICFSSFSFTLKSCQNL